MKRSHMQMLLVGIAVLALSAGVVAGLLAAKLPLARAGGTGLTGTAPIPPGPGPLDRGSLADALELNEQQRVQMRDIWEGTRAKVHETFNEAQSLQKQRDDDLIALLDEKGREQFAKISQDYKQRFEALARQRDADFQAAVTRTKEILSESQRSKYEEILQSHVPPNRVGGEPAPGMGPPPPPIDGAAATRKSSDPGVKD